MPEKQYIDFGNQKIKIEGNSTSRKSTKDVKKTNLVCFVSLEGNKAEQHGRQRDCYWVGHWWCLCPLVSSCGFHLYLPLFFLPKLSTHYWIQTVIVNIHIFLIGPKRKVSNIIHLVKEVQFLDKSSVYMTALPFLQFLMWLTWIDISLEIILEIHGNTLNSQEMFKLNINYDHLWFIDKH